MPGTEIPSLASPRQLVLLRSQEAHRFSRQDTPLMGLTGRLTLSTRPLSSLGFGFPLWHEGLDSLTCRSVPLGPGAGGVGGAARSPSARSWLGLGSQQRAAAGLPLPTGLCRGGVFPAHPHTGPSLGVPCPLRGEQASETQPATQLSPPSPPLSGRPTSQDFPGVPQAGPEEAKGCT